MPLAEPLPPPLDDAMAVLEEPPAEEVSLPPPLPGPLRKAKLVFCRLLGRPTPTISVVVQRGFQEASRERAAQIQRQCVVNFFCVATIQGQLRGGRIHAEKRDDNGTCPRGKQLIQLMQLMQLHPPRRYRPRCRQ